MRRKVSAGLADAIKYALLAALVVFFLLPIFSLLMASFKSGKELMRYGISFKGMIPPRFDPKNFVYLVTGKDGIYLSWFRNSVIVLAAQTVLSLGLSSFVGYGLGVYRFKGRNAITVMVLLVMMVPLQILLLPLYAMIVNFKLMNTYQGVILPFMVSPFAIFFFRQFASGIPKDYLDAGRIEGLGEFNIFLFICAPLMAPAFGAMAILMAQQSWNNFLWPLIVMTTGEMFTLPIGLASLLTPYGNNYDMLIAGSCAASVPIIIVFVFFQRYFISGMNAGGIKG
ncbi:MAG: arabinose transporter permease [Treponema sp. GWB1_62_6]|nr:MAG: arabinose transporter permease [Treponema sp. GWC1_61_84]OHE65630.1 MAG: arabinose transporter permease [Treponema sp. GWA1_62_8]OHE68887.1 MAG: arabinose transporter permease [Treponema sp. GWB1_62_6]OHE72694.1 MAG: arabinose transporter permease [Treponema sp. RIFOXYC1_FULL_61_9]HCM27757.1 arabinose transporter permease [Treponema sp.]